MDLSSPEVFKRMYREQLSYVLSTLGRMGVPNAQVEDLCHDVFMAAFRKRADFEPTRPLKPWLFGIAYRIVLNLKRKASTSGGEEELGKIADGGRGPEEALQQKQARSALQDAISTLEPERRAVFLLHDLDGQPAPEIARALEIPLNTAYSRLRLARADVLRATQGLRQEGHP